MSDFKGTKKQNIINMYLALFAIFTLIFLRELITDSITLLECSMPILIASGSISLTVNKI